MSNTDNSVTPAAARTTAMNEMRSELHRYCARLTGSVIDGEDVVQDAFMKAYAAFDRGGTPESLRPWLFRIAHNRALDLLRSRSVRTAQPLDEEAEAVKAEELDPLEVMMRQEAVTTAVSRFAELPIAQRSVVILKDVLDMSLEETATLLDTTVNAVKAHLARGRRRLAEINARVAAPQIPEPPSELVARYVRLFNDRDWDGLRALLASDVKLNQATHPPRRGAADVGMFFSIYAKEPPVRLVPARLEYREVMAVYEAAQATPSYFMWIEQRDGRVSFIHDYKYARYITDGAELLFQDHR